MHPSAPSQQVWRPAQETRAYCANSTPYASKLNLTLGLFLFYVGLELGLCEHTQGPERGGSRQILPSFHGYCGSLKDDTATLR
jgi:hypothetical protein